MNKRKLIIARKKIDSLDKEIFKLIKSRTLVVNQMLKIKDHKSQIIDKKRINQILRKIKKKSIANNIDPSITKKIWKSMIWSYVDYQKRNFSKK